LLTTFGPYMETLLPGKSMYILWAWYLNVISGVLKLQLYATVFMWFLIWSWMEQIPQEHWYPFTKLHIVTSQNTIILILLRLWEPKISFGVLFVQEMSIRKINVFSACCLAPFLLEIFRLFAWLS
jgi:hypothetical protein